MTENPTPETSDVPEEELLNVDEYDIPVVEDDTDDQFPAFIAGSTLIVRLEDPGELRLPLKLSYNQIKDLKAEMPEDAEELDQLIKLLEIVGDEATVEVLKDIDMADAVAVALLYFRAWKQRTQLSLGKLRGSLRK